MHSYMLRYVACAALLVSATACGVQAPTANAASTLPDFTSIVEKNAPAVVQVEAKYAGGKQATQQSMSGQMGPDQGQGMPNGAQAEILRQLFGIPMMPSPEEQKHSSLGSGFIISKDGYILTNNHVVAGADTVTVRLQDRRTLTAKVVGTDPTYDIALLKIDAGSSLPTVSIGDSSSLKPGQWVLAIGSPFGFDYTVTQGIVSAVGRSLGEASQEYTSFIQTDVPINRGNSGGPLFNLQGKVVGINSQIYSNTGDYLGVSFSIPINVAMNAVQQIKTKGYVSRGMLGVLVQPVSDDMVKALGLENGSGAAVTQVTPDSGAAKAGIQAGDIILSFDGHDVEQPADLPPMVGMTKPVTKVPVGIMRDGKKQTLQVTIGESPRDQGAVDNNGAAGAPGWFCATTIAAAGHCTATIATPGGSRTSAPSVAASARRPRAAAARRLGVALALIEPVERAVGPPQQVARGAVLDDLTARHHDHAVAVRLDDLQRMLHDDDRDTGVADPQARLADPAHEVRSHADHRLIEEQQLRRAHQAARDLHQAPLPAAELRAVVVAQRPQIQLIEHAHGVGSSSCRRGFRARTAGHRAAQRGSRVADARDQQILKHGQAVKDAGRLEGPDDPEPRSPMCRQARDVVIAQHHGPAGDRGLAADRREQRRLAGAVRANQADDLRHGDPHRGAADRFHPSVAHADIAGIEHRVAGDARGPSAPVTQLAIRD